MPGFLQALRLSRAPAVCFAGMGLVWGSFNAALPDIKATLGVSDGEMGALLIWGSVAAIAMMSLAPRLGDPLGRAALPVFGLAMGGAAALMGNAASAPGFVLALMAMGAATGALDVFMNARLSAIETASGRSLMNLNHALYSLAFASAAVATGAARSAGLGAPVILGMVALTVAALALTSWERDGAIGGLTAARGAPRAALGLLPVLGGGLILAGLMTENAVEAWSALYVERDLGGATGAGSLAPALMALTMGLGRLAGQSVSARVPDRTLLRVGLGVTMLGIATVIAAPGQSWAYAGFVVLGLGVSVVVPTALSVIGRASPDATRSRAIARATVLGYLGYFVGPPLLGLIAEIAGLRGSFGVILVVLAGALILAQALTRRG
ncbi:MAG: MFS transporter [Rhodobacter sp.]|nr:MFS transporter [Rhodobacter sp.]